jgi:hypothetical protein
MIKKKPLLKLSKFDQEEFLNHLANPKNDLTCFQCLNCGHLSYHTNVNDIGEPSLPLHDDQIPEPKTLRLK